MCRHFLLGGQILHQAFCLSSLPRSWTVGTYSRYQHESSEWELWETGKTDQQRRLDCPGQPLREIQKPPTPLPPRTLKDSLSHKFFLLRLCLLVLRQITLGGSYFEPITHYALQVFLVCCCLHLFMYPSIHSANIYCQ